MQPNKNGKNLLVESCSSNQYQNLSKIEKFSHLTEKANRLWIKANSDKLDESFKKDLNKLEESSNQSSHMIKRVVDHLEEKGLTPPTLYKFPISKVNTVDNPNINNRVYSADLWDNVLNNQRNVWQYNTGLTDHPEDDGHFMDQGIVWLDGERDGDIIYGIGALVGKAKDLAQDIMAVGGKIGFSTAGYGDVDDKGVVDPDTYEIERFADLVLNPSQGVFGNYEDVASKPMNATIENKKTVRESVENKGRIELKNIKLKESVNFSAMDICTYLNEMSKPGFECKCEDDTVVVSWDSGDGICTWTATKKEDGFLVSCDPASNPEVIIKAEDIEDLIFKSDYWFEGDINFKSEKEWNKIGKDFDEVDSTDFIKQIQEEEEVTEDEVETSEEETPEVTEDEDETSDETLSEQLIRKHYLTKINEIGKRPGREWEDKIKCLEHLVKLANKEALSEKTKKELNNKINLIIDGIMKETSAIISKGYDAKELCEDIGISDIKLLSGVNSTVEEFAALKESFVKTRKSLKKFKGLYEDKQKALIEYAKENVHLEKQLERVSNELKEATNRNRLLKNKLTTVLNENRSLENRLRLNDVKIHRYEKTLKASQQLNNKYEEINESITNKAKHLSEMNKKYLAESQKYERNLTNFKAKESSSDFLREDSEIRNIFESAGKQVRDHKYKTAQEAKNAILFENTIIDEKIPFKADDVNSLSELFN